MSNLETIYWLWMSYSEFATEITEQNLDLHLNQFVEMLQAQCFFTTNQDVRNAIDLLG